MHTLTQDAHREGCSKTDLHSHWTADIGSMGRPENGLRSGSEALELWHMPLASTHHANAARTAPP